MRSCRPLAESNQLSIVNGQWSIVNGVVLLLLFLAGCQSSDVVVVTPTLTPSPTLLPLQTAVSTQPAATATVILATPTPFPTVTPAPSPTPVIYTVQDGDTLLAIAINHQTTTEAIEALNPEVDARLLSIGQTIILPSSPTITIAAAEVNAPVPIQAEIVNISSYDTPLGGVWVLGEVKNSGNAPIANVQIEVALATITQTAWAATAVISPNQTAPFAVLFPQQIEVQPVVSIIGGESVGDLGDRYVALTAVDTALEIMGDGVLVNGRLRNNGTLTATQISLTTTFYDADGAITGYDYRVLGDELLPAAAISFSFITTPPSGNTTDFTITAQGKSESIE